MDPPRHHVLRGVMARGFAPRRMTGAIPEFIADVRAAMDHALERGRCDIVGDLTRPTLLAALGRILGLDAAAARRAAQLQSGLFHNTEGPLGSALPAAELAAVFALLREQLERRRREPGDDLFSVLLVAQAAGADMSDEEIVANMTTVLLAGSASIGHFLPNVTHALWRHPDARAEVVGDLGLVDAAIEEAVRWDTSTQAFARIVQSDAMVGECTIPAGSRVVLLYGSANRDERAIQDADHFEIHRSRVRHFGFGGGPHHCLGAPTARLLCKAFLQTFLPVLPDYELDVERAERVEHIMVRGFRSLDAVW